jgi:hypothetical protein
MPFPDALRRHPTARRLAPVFDAEALRAELASVEGMWHRHAGPYHDGAWESVSLWAPRGDAAEQRSSGGSFAATPVLRSCPAIGAVLDNFPHERNRIRLMRLRPGGHILRHSDPLHTIDRRLVRLHIPIETNPGVHFLVNDRRVVMSPGETWHVDVRFPHEVANRGDSIRVHLVLDLMRDDALDAMLARGVSVDTGWLTGYYAKHLLPGRLRRAWGLEN